MTREEAIDIFEHNWTRLVNPDYTEEELNKAFGIALEALEQEPFINKPCVSEKVCEHDKQMVLDKIKWLIEQYESEIEKCAEDRRNMPMSPTQAYLTAKMGVYGKVIADLKELIESEDRHE